MEKFFYLLILFCEIVQSVQIPKQIHKFCDRDSVNFKECLKEAIQKTVKNMEKGIPEFGVPALDPYVEKKAIIDYERNQLRGKIILTDAYIAGLSKSRIRAVRTNLQDDFMDLEIDMTNKLTTLQANMNAEGRFNFLLLKTPRTFLNITMDDAIMPCRIRAEIVVKNNTKYMKVKEFILRPDFKHINFQFKNLLEDNPDLKNLVTNFAKNNWRLIYEELSPVLHGLLRQIVTRITNKIFLKIPYNELFPTSFE